MAPRRCRSRWTAAAAAAALALVGSASAGEERESTAARDLAYGEVLFHFYQQDYFTALVRLLAARARNEIPSHAADAELLLGGLHLSYGQHRRAGSIFERVLAEHDDPAVRDRAWFFLAKVWHQRGYLEDAEAALARIGGALPPSLESERRLLGAQLRMDQGRFDDARAVLESWSSPGDEWAGYAAYNLGVALLRLGKTEQGAAMLERLGARPPDGDSAAGEAAAALRDKANVALGYAWLQSGEAERAKPALQRVRLDGPYSNKALLGVGWADAELGAYRSALVPWIELKQRSVLHTAVQESLLAVPYGFAQLGADGQAAEHYVDALGTFDAEIERVEGAIASVRGGELVDALLARNPAESNGWYFELDVLPETVESRYLRELLGTHAFQEALKNTRDLVQLIDNLSRWAESLVAFDRMLDTRQRAFAERLPRVEEGLERLDLDAMSARRVQLEARLQRIERDRDVVALGTPEQQRLWAELTAVEPDLARLGDAPTARELRSKQRFLKGLLLWELDRDYKVRLWEHQSALRRLDLELKQAQARRYSVTAARDAWPDRFESMTARVAALGPRIDALRDAALDALARQRRFVESLAIEELETRRERLAAYRVQARFSLAALYDRASASAAADGGGR